MKLYIEPKFRGEDRGEGGIRRVVEAQYKWLPEYGWEMVQSLDEADIVATHAGNMPTVPVGKPWVVHNHGLYWAEYDWPKWCQDLNRRVIEAMRRADCVTAPSRWVAHALERGMWLKPSVLRHGVDFDEWQNGNNEGYVLWNKTRVDPVCDPRPLMRLARMLPGMQFVTTFGDESDNVKVTGKLPFLEAAVIVKNAGVYLCTARETMGIGTLEAMAAGVPVVGWNWGGQAEIVEYKATGWLCDPGDYDGLAEGLEWCQKNHAVMSANCKNAILNQHTWDIVMKQYADLYCQLLDEFSVKKPKVSVIVPCYKLAHFLPDTIKSIQAQTMEDWEMIIVDDASPDNTAKVANEHAKNDGRIKVVRNRKNLYLAGSLNEGIRHSRGKYVLPLDADNMLDAEALGILSNALDKDRSFHIAYGAVKFVQEDGKMPDENVGLDGISKWPGEFSFREQMLHRNQIPSTCMYRREVWRRTGGYRTRCRTAEDAEFWTRATSLGFRPQKVTNSVTLVYRQRNDSMSRVEADWDWTAWFPWSRHKAVLPFGVAVEPPSTMGLAWPVPSHELPLISVVIIVGPGHEGYLIDALDSVQAQTFDKWEVVLVNDTGKPLAVPHPWVKMVDTPGGIGPANARNLGVEMSKAPLFVPLDADDYLQPDALMFMYEAWQETGDVIYSQWYDDYGNGDGKIYDPPEYNAWLLIKEGCIHAITALYPKSAWQQVGGFDPAIRNWEDWDFQLSLAHIGICSTKLPFPLFTYRKTTGFRREENYASFEEGKQSILTKWHSIWEGKEELMACSGCPQRKAASRPLSSAISKPSGDVAGSGLVLLEYAGGPNTITFVGQVTKTKYRFGGNAGHSRKYVFAQDAPTLLTIRHFKEIHEGQHDQSPKLEVVGAPSRQQEVSVNA